MKRAKKKVAHQSKSWGRASIFLGDEKHPTTESRETWISEPCEEETRLINRKCHKEKSKLA